MGRKAGMRPGMRSDCPVGTGGRTPMFPNHVDAPNAGAKENRNNTRLVTSSEHRHGDFSPSTTPPLWSLRSEARDQHGARVPRVNTNPRP